MVPHIHIRIISFAYSKLASVRYCHGNKAGKENPLMSRYPDISCYITNTPFMWVVVSFHFIVQPRVSLSTVVEGYLFEEWVDHLSGSPEWITWVDRQSESLEWIVFFDHLCTLKGFLERVSLIEMECESLESIPWIHWLRSVGSSSLLRGPPGWDEAWNPWLRRSEGLLCDPSSPIHYGFLNQLISQAFIY